MRIEPTIRPAGYEQWKANRERNLSKPVDNPTQRSTVEGVPRIVFQTLWRTPNERVPTMKAVATDEVIIVTRSREAVPNPFLEVNSKTKIRAIDQFAKDNKTVRITLDEGESLGSTIQRLRDAAKGLTPSKGVRVSYDGTGTQTENRKTAKSFRFELIPFVARQATTTPAS